MAASRPHATGLDLQHRHDVLRIEASATERAVPTLTQCCQRTPAPTAQSPWRQAPVLARQRASVSRC